MAKPQISEIFEQAHQELSAESRAAIQRVLVVDDSRAQVKISASLLRRWGYEVTEASSAAQAIELIRQKPVDLILSDWMMPGMTGLDLRAALAEEFPDQFFYFILLTSRSEKADISQALESGADDFLTKPLNVEELHARLSSAERLLRMQRDVTRKNRLLLAALEELQDLYDVVDRDLVEARHLQQSLVPERLLRFDGADVSLMLQPSGHIGGDLVGAFRVGDRRIAAFAIDVSGHGIASALMSARLSGYLTGTSPGQNIAMGTDDLGLYSLRPVEDVCRDLNRIVLEELETDMYFTFVMADCDLKTGAVRMVQAGHPHPMVQRADGRIEFVGRGGHPVGLIPEAEFAAFDLRLELGDRLLIYSDGLTECPSGADGLVGQDGLADILQSQKSLKGLGFLDALSWTLAERAGQRELPDDISAVLIEYVGSDSAK